MSASAPRKRCQGMAQSDCRIYTITHSEGNLLKIIAAVAGVDRDRVSGERGESFPIASISWNYLHAVA